jgi:hypothetical protein
MSWMARLLYRERRDTKQPAADAAAASAAAAGDALLLSGDAARTQHARRTWRDEMRLRKLLGGVMPQ